MDKEILLPGTDIITYENYFDKLLCISRNEAYDLRKHRITKTIIEGTQVYYQINGKNGHEFHDFEVFDSEDIHRIDIEFHDILKKRIEKG